MMKEERSQTKGTSKSEKVIQEPQKERFEFICRSVRFGPLYSVVSTV